MKQLPDRDLQEYIHNVGLEKFLGQLETVFRRCYQDTSTFDVKQIPVNYSMACAGISHLKDVIFPAKEKHHG